MSEKRFEASWNMHRTLHYSSIIDKENKKVYCVEQYHTNVEKVVDLLNEQQATICKLQDLCGESDSENAKLRIENEQLRQSVEYWQKKYEEGTETLEIGEQQATIKKLQEEKEYWESKAMTLLMQVRRLTSRMTDKEVEEFKKELEE